MKLYLFIINTILTQYVSYGIIFNMLVYLRSHLYKFILYGRTWICEEYYRDNH